MESLIQSLFTLSPKVRYVALLRGTELQLHERPGLSHASELDCGGLDYVWIRYGNFWTGLFPTADGHVNVGLEPDAVPTEHVPAIRAVLARAERGPG